MNRRKDTFGFTIIEILLVIFIIGLLSAVGVNVYLEQQKSSRDATRKSDMYLIASGLDNYYSVNKKYPLGEVEPNNLQPSSGGSDGYYCYFFSDGTLKSSSTGSTVQSCNGYIDQNQWIPELVGTYISKLPTDPKQKSESLPDYTKVVKDSTTNQWTGSNYFYFYLKLNEITINRLKLAEIPQKYYFIGVALENLDDKDTVFNSKKKFAGKSISYGLDGSINLGLNKNLFVVTSEL